MTDMCTSCDYVSASLQTTIHSAVQCVRRVWADWYLVMFTCRIVKAADCTIAAHMISIPASHVAWLGKVRSRHNTSSTLHYPYPHKNRKLVTSGRLAHLTRWHQVYATRLAGAFCPVITWPMWPLRHVMPAADNAPRNPTVWIQLFTMPRMEPTYITHIIIIIINCQPDHASLSACTMTANHWLHRQCTPPILEGNRRYIGGFPHW